MYSLKREAVEALKGESVKAWKRGRSVGRFNPSTLQPFNAFTLLELLIAVSIFAMVLTAINGVFYGAMRLQSKSSRAVEESLPAQQTVAPTEEGKQAAEMMLIGSSIKVAPIVEWDGQPIGDGKPGPITQKLLQLWEEDTQSATDQLVPVPYSEGF